MNGELLEQNAYTIAVEEAAEVMQDSDCVRILKEGLNFLANQVTEYYGSTNNLILPIFTGRSGGFERVFFDAMYSRLVPQIQARIVEPFYVPTYASRSFYLPGVVEEVEPEKCERFDLQGVLTINPNEHPLVSLPDNSEPYYYRFPPELLDKLTEGNYDLMFFDSIIGTGKKCFNLLNCIKLASTNGVNYKEKVVDISPGKTGFVSLGISDQFGLFADLYVSPEYSKPKNWAEYVSQIVAALPQKSFGNNFRYQPQGYCFFTNNYPDIEYDIDFESRAKMLQVLKKLAQVEAGYQEARNTGNLHFRNSTRKVSGEEIRANFARYFALCELIKQKCIINC